MSESLEPPPVPEPGTTAPPIKEPPPPDQTPPVKEPPLV
jgi:hypothetical protein